MITVRRKPPGVSHGDISKDKNAEPLSADFGYSYSLVEPHEF